MSLNNRKEQYGAAHIKKLNADVAAVAGQLEGVLAGKDVPWGLAAREGQVTAAWAVFTALDSRLETLKRRYSALAAGLEPSDSTLTKVKSGLADYPRPTQAQLLSLIDHALGIMSNWVDLWSFLSGQGALLLLGDGYPKASDAGQAVNEALALIAELRDFIGDIYADVPVHRLKATMRQVRDILEDVTD